MSVQLKNVFIGRKLGLKMLQLQSDRHGNILNSDTSAADIGKYEDIK